MVERREKTSTEGRGLGFSFAADNVERGDSDADFIKRRPTFPLGDDPRAREIDFADTTGDVSYNDRPVFRAYKGRYPLEGQDPLDPKRVASLQKSQSLRAELPSLSVDFAALEATKVSQRAILFDTDYRALFPTTAITSPAPGASFSAGTRITIIASAASLINIQSAVLIINNGPVDTVVLDRRDQAVATSAEWIFLYDIPANQPLGAMDITVRTFNISNAFRGFIADDAKNDPPQDESRTGALGTLDGQPGSSTSSADYQPLLDETQYLRTPGGSTTISINIV